jgi:hypothetical protein
MRRRRQGIIMYICYYRGVGQELIVARLEVLKVAELSPQETLSKVVAIHIPDILPRVIFAV